jgi:DNA-binding NtrC family response regulator
MDELSGSPARVLTRVLIIGNDRRYRAVTATLLSQRGYDVSCGAGDEDVVALAVRERAEIVVIDATPSLTVTAQQAARLGELRPRVGVVVVSSEAEPGLAALPLLPKWGKVDGLLEAIGRASRAGATHALL